MADLVLTIGLICAAVVIGLCMTVIVGALCASTCYKLWPRKGPDGPLLMSLEEGEDQGSTTYRWDG